MICSGNRYADHHDDAGCILRSEVENSKGYATAFFFNAHDADFHPFR